MPVHLFYGTDEYAITSRVNEFQRGMGDPTTAAMNTSRLDGRTVTEDDLNNAVNSMPFLASQRLIIFSSPSARYTQASQQKKFLEFLKQAPESANLILIEAGQLKETHWLVKWRETPGKMSMPRRTTCPNCVRCPNGSSKKLRLKVGRLTGRRPLASLK
jgi:DNA polymerase III delta subunit